MADNFETMEHELLGHVKIIERLQKENSALRKEVDHLKELLTATAPLIGGDVKIEVPKEQAACEIQLRILHDKAQQRELTLEETKKLEILIKSLYHIKDKSTGTIIGDGAQMSVEALTNLAQHGE